jgi:hypothetical protein
MGSHWLTPTGSWDSLGIIAFCPGVTVEFLGMTTLDPLGRRGFYTHGSFLEKVPFDVDQGLMGQAGYYQVVFYVGCNRVRGRLLWSGPCSEDTHLL